MNFYKLNLFNNFECIGSECSDTCCKGWNIFIDDNTAGYYNFIQVDFTCPSAAGKYKKECLYAIGWLISDVGFFHDFSDDDIAFKEDRLR